MIYWCKYCREKIEVFDGEETICPECSARLLLYNGTGVEEEVVTKGDYVSVDEYNELEQQLSEYKRRFASIGSEKTVGEGASSSDSFLDHVLSRAFYLIKIGDFKTARGEILNLLEYNSNCAKAYLALLMIDLEVRTPEALASCSEPFDRNVNYKAILTLNDIELILQLQGYIKSIQLRKTGRKHNRKIQKAFFIVIPLLIIIVSAIMVLVNSVGGEDTGEEESVDAGLKIIIESKRAIVSGYSGTNDAVVIPSEYKGCPVTSIGESAFVGCSWITSVTLPDSVTSIENFAFSGCTSLTRVIIPNKVTSIGEDAFRNCRSLKSIVIPKNVKIIGKNVFGGCYALKEISFIDTSTWYVTRSSEGSGATNIDVSNVGENVINMTSKYSSHYWFKK